MALSKMEYYEYLKDFTNPRVQVMADRRVLIELDEYLEKSETGLQFKNEIKLLEKKLKDFMIKSLDEKIINYFLEPA